jgi:uncharacterized protein (TIGR00369 family)
MAPTPIADRRTSQVPLSAANLSPECALARLDVQLTEVEDRRAVGRTTVGPQHLNQRGQVQGGVYGVLADAVAGWATEAFLGGEHYVTTAINGQFLGAVSLGDIVRTEAEVVHGGRTMVVCAVRLWRDQGPASRTLVAMFTCQQLVLGSSRSTRD